MSTKKSVTAAAGIMSATILLSRVLGLVRESVISGVFGQTRWTDIYLAAFNIPDTLFFLIAGGALSSAFIRVFKEYLTTGNEEQAWKTFSVIATIMGLVITTFILIGEIFTRQLVPYIGGKGYNSSELDSIASLTRIVLPSQFFFFLGGLMMGTLNARGKFLIPGLGPSVYNLGIITGGALLGSRIGVAGLCWGALTGAFVGNFLMQLIALRRAGVSFKPSLDYNDPGAKKVWKLMLPVIFGLALPQIDVLINRWVASYLSGGLVTALVRGNNLMQVPVGVFGQSTAIGFFPTLTEQAVKNEKEEFKNTLNYGLRLILFAAIPSSVFLAVLAKPISALLFQHGAFTANDSVAVSITLIFYSIGVSGWCMQALVARSFYAMNDSFTPVWTGTLMTLIFVPLKYIIAKYGGDRLFWMLALGTSLSAATQVSLLLFIARKRLGGIHGRKLLSSVAKIISASALIALIGLFLNRHIGLPDTGTAVVKLHSFLIVIGTAVFGGAAFFTVVKKMRLDEAQSAWNLITDRFPIVKRN